jgi:hypothetical protein
MRGCRGKTAKKRAALVVAVAPQKPEYRAAMTDTISYGQLRQESRLLFALLDAVASEGRMIGTEHQTRWQALKSRVNTGASFEEESPESYELLADLAHTGALHGTWIESRWLTLAARLQAGD